MKKLALFAIILLSFTSCTIYQLDYSAPTGPDQRVNPYDVQRISPEGTLAGAIGDAIRH